MDSFRFPLMEHLPPLTHNTDAQTHTHKRNQSPATDPSAIAATLSVQEKENMTY